MKYDLEDRTTEFGKRVIRLCKAIPNNNINDRLIRQVVGSSDAVGANYREANPQVAHRMNNLIREAQELISIFSAIVRNLENPKPEEDNNGK